MALKAPTNEKETLCREFAEEHGIPSESIAEREGEAIFWLESSRRAAEQSFPYHRERLVLEPTWGLLVSMLDRAYEYAAAALALIVRGQTSAAEVVARTTAEAAINVLYVLDGDRAERLWQYFSSYITEKTTAESAVAKFPFGGFLRGKASTPPCHRTKGSSPRATAEGPCHGFSADRCWNQYRPQMAQRVRAIPRGEQGN